MTDENAEATQKGEAPEQNGGHLPPRAEEESESLEKGDQKVNGELSAPQGGNVCTDEESTVTDEIALLGSAEDGVRDSSFANSEMVPGFVTARSILRENLLRQDAFLSPGFRSVAAMAGWDDEALLLATEDGDPSLNLPEAKSPAFFAKSPQFTLLGAAREKKREERTPQLAATPLSAGRRHRRARRQAIHEFSPEALPIGDLSLKEEFQEAVSQPSVEKEHDAAHRVQKDQRQEEPACMTSVHSIAATKATSQKPACLDQLREELSCAICLDICFEPSTISCGHSFCKHCMESVLQKCGSRCPKCRQQLKGGSGRSCPVNVVLWNTVQLLFPAEVAARKEAADLARKAEAAACGNEATGGMAERAAPTGAESMRGIASWQNARPPSSGLRRRGNGRRTASIHRSEEQTFMPAEMLENQQNFASIESVRERQVLADAAFARRLQTQLMGRRGGSSNGWRSTSSSSSSSSSTNLASAAANLRAMASRAVRHRSRQ